MWRRLGEKKRIIIYTIQTISGPTRQSQIMNASDAKYSYHSVMIGLGGVFRKKAFNVIKSAEEYAPLDIEDGGAQKHNVISY